MKRYIVLILLTLAPLFLQANTSNINECISDIYFANSIMTIKDDADKYKDLIKKKVLKEQYNNDLSKMDKELNFKTSYNRTHGYYKDIYDTYMFVSSEEDGWDTYKKIISLFLDKGIGKVIGKVTNLSKKEEELLDKLLDSIDLQNHVDIYDVDRNADLSKQIKDYRDSIRLGHSIVIVAHGKGDIFTAKAYEEMLKPEGARENGWLAEYVNWMSVGSPTREVRDTYINFDNDSLPYVGTLETKNNPNRSFTQNAVGEVFENNFDMQFHSFNYYMGEPILFQDGLGKRNISTDIGKKMIMNFLKNSIKKHRDAYSQWALDQEYNKNTKANRITVKHLHDSVNIIMDKEVYPFAPTKKLYQVNGEYVKASCGGTKILDADDDTWANKKSNEFYYLEGTGETIFEEAQDILKYDKVKLIYFVKSYSAYHYYNHTVKMILVGYIGSKYYIISTQYDGFTDYEKYHRPRVYINTTDVKDLKSFVGTNLILPLPVVFKFTQDIYNQLIE